MVARESNKILVNIFTLKKSPTSVPVSTLGTTNSAIDIKALEPHVITRFKKREEGAPSQLRSNSNIPLDLFSLRAQIINEHNTD